jgi:hypothetical protein
MSGQPPQPANQRKQDDQMAPRFAALDGHYSIELLSMVRACLALDPLARPQSVFALQKVLQAALPAATAARKREDEKPQGGWRGLVDKLGVLKRGKAGGEG